MEGNDEAPKAENDEAAFKAWSGKNAMALGVIRYSDEGPLKWAIWKITSAKIAWDTLSAICTIAKSSFIGISRSLSYICTCSYIYIHTPTNYTNNFFFFTYLNFEISSMYWF